MDIDRRRDYQVVGTQDIHVSPLLREQIQEGISGCAAEFPKGFRVLDIGAGECPWKTQLEAAGARYFSFDLSQNRAGTIDFVGGIDTPLPPDVMIGGAYDLLVCTEVLEHVIHWPVAFENFSRLLVPGGKIIVTCPFFYMLHEEPHDFWRPTDHALKQFAGKYGFSVCFEKRLGSGNEVLGTLLGSLHVQRRSKTRGAYLPALLVHFSLNFLRWLLGLAWVKENAAIEGRFYLSNFFILRKTIHS